MKPIVDQQPVMAIEIGLNVLENHLKRYSLSIQPISTTCSREFIWKTQLLTDLQSAQLTTSRSYNGIEASANPDQPKLLTQLLNSHFIARGENRADFHISARSLFDFLFRSAADAFTSIDPRVICGCSGSFTFCFHYCGTSSSTCIG